MAAARITGQRGNWQIDDTCRRQKVTEQTIKTVGSECLGLKPGC
jgi:hypothetical protein